MKDTLKQEEIYIDITQIILNTASPKSHNIRHAKSFVDDNGNVYYVDNKKNGVLFDKKSNDYIQTKRCAI